jgi:hypothetical protein
VVTGDDGAATGDGPHGDAPADAPSDGHGDAPFDASGDSALDGGDAGPTDGADAGCSSTMALLAGGSNTLAGATFAHGQWSSASALTGNMATVPAIAAYNGAYMASFVTTATPGHLDWTGYTSSWSAPSQIASALAQGTPSLATIGSAAHVVYWGSDGKFYHGTYSSSAWDAANDPVGGSGANQSFGSSGPAVAAVGTTLVVTQSGSNGTLYDQTWNGSWQTANAHSGSAVVSTITPAIVAMNGGNADLMIVFVHGGNSPDYHLQYTTRTSSTWSASAEVYNQSGNVAYSSATPSLAALPSGKAVVAWLGGNGKGYASSYDPSSGWTAPGPIASTTIAATPSLAPGVCGGDAVAAFAQSTGEVDVATLTGSTWSTPLAIAGATGMQAVAIASTP